MNKAISKLKRIHQVPLDEQCRAAWRFLRTLSGDDAYERYVDHLAQAHPDRSPPTRPEFHRERLASRWNRVSRCC